MLAVWCEAYRDGLAARGMLVISKIVHIECQEAS